MRANRWAGVLALVVTGGFIAGCSYLSKQGGRASAPGEIVFLFTGDTAGELKGCG